MSRAFKIVKINNKDVNRGRYTTNSSPSSVAKKVFSKLYGKMKNTLTSFMIKETTQGSSKKVYGPYKGKRIKLKKPRMVKFKGTNKPVPIRYETKIYKVKGKKGNKKIQKGGGPPENFSEELTQEGGVSTGLEKLFIKLNVLINQLNHKAKMGTLNSFLYSKGYKYYADALVPYTRSETWVFNDPLHSNSSLKYNKTLEKIDIILDKIIHKINNRYFASIFKTNSFKNPTEIALRNTISKSCHEIKTYMCTITNKSLENLSRWPLRLRSTPPIQLLKSLTE